MTLEEIIGGCKKNSLVHQKALYNIYGQILFRLSLKYCSSEAEAEDNLHDAFIEIFSTINRFENKGSFEGWMKRITINKAISKYKKSITSTSLDNLIYPLVDTEVEMHTEDFSLDYLLKLIQELPNQYRLVFNLYELDDYSHKEISEILGISEGTSKSNLHKAKLILKDKLSENTPRRYKNGI